MDDGDEPSPPKALPDDLVDRLRRLDDLRLAALAGYADDLVAHRTRPVSEVVREREDPDRIVEVEDHDGFAVVTRRDAETGTPILYHVTREHHPDGEVDLKWRLVGRVVD